jgi:hypothetical protein
MHNQPRTADQPDNEIASQKRQNEKPNGQSQQHLQNKNRHANYLKPQCESRKGVIYPSIPRPEWKQNRITLWQIPATGGAVSNTHVNVLLWSCERVRCLNMRWPLEFSKGQS